MNVMDSKQYLESYGWKEGEALRRGGLRRPILVKHKKDKKGLGCAPGQDDSEAWWERLFDGHLKNLDIGNDSKDGGITFKQNEVVASSISKSASPLYRWFVRGEGLKGTIEKSSAVEKEQLIVAKVLKKTLKRRRDDDDGVRKLRKAKKEKKQKKAKKEKKQKKDKKDKKQKKQKKDKKDKKDKNEVSAR